MAFARIRSLRSHRRRNSTTPTIVASPPETKELPETSPIEIEGKIQMEDAEIEELPIKEIAIDLTQNDSNNNNTHQSHSFEVWNIHQNIPTCNCGLSAANGIPCLTDGLCGIIPPPPVETQKNTPKSPFFLKVPKVNPNKSGFITPPRERRGEVCSISPVVSELGEVDGEEKQQQQQQPQVETEQLSVEPVKQPGLNEVERNHVANNKVQSLHLQVRPLEKSNETSGNKNDDGISSQKSEQTYKPKYSSELIRLPMRAGRSKLRDIPVQNADVDEVSPDRQRRTRPSAVTAKSTDRMSIPTQTQSLPTAYKNRITRLPVRAGRTNKVRDDNDVDLIENGRSSRRGFAERRRYLIAATKKEEPPIIPQLADDKSCIDYFPLIHISHDLSFDNDEEIEATMTNSTTPNHAEVCKSKMCRGESNTTKGSLDYTTASSHETLEETFEETFEYSSEGESTLAFEKVGCADDRITKAGWITRQLYRDCRRDRVDGAQNVELVYTLD